MISVTDIEAYLKAELDTHSKKYVLANNLLKEKPKKGFQALKPKQKKELQRIIRDHSIVIQTLHKTLGYIEDNESVIINPNESDKENQLIVTPN